MIRPRLEACARAYNWVLAWRFTKPLARVFTALAGLVFLAFVGGHAVPGALAGSTPSAAAVASVTQEPPPQPSPPAQSVEPPGSPPVPTVLESGPGFANDARASPSDPVVLNSATSDDLRRLPGIGQKRADAIVNLRSHLGRFHALEDLLKR